MPATRGRIPPALALALGVLLGAAAARGQAGLPVGHPPTDAPVRPVHERVAAADAAVVARVERVDEGRIAVAALDVLWGAPPQRFEVKRSPLAPPPLARGDRALLLLSGARPPYVLVDEPGETIRLPDDASAARWAGALRSVHAAAGDDDALATLYLGWMDDGPETLRSLGAASLGALLDAEGAQAAALRARVAQDRAKVAADPRAEGSARRLSAALAAAEPRAAAQLARELVAHDAVDDAPVVELSLRGAALARAPELGPLFDAAAASPVPEVREAAMRSLEVVVALTGDARLATARSLREGDPEPAVRRAAERALERFDAAGGASAPGDLSPKRRLGPPGPTTPPPRTASEARAG